VIRVVVADDEAVVRGGLVMILDAHDDLQVVGEAVDGRDAVEIVRATAPDVLLLDVQMPHMDGLQALAELRRQGATTAVLVLTTFDLDEYAYAALQAGASGFLLKTTPPAKLVDAVRSVALGDALLAPTVTRRMVERFARMPAPYVDGHLPPALHELTPREIDVLRCVARGMSNVEVSRTLFMAEATVKSHVNRTLTKLALRDRVQLVILAYECGLTSPGRQAESGQPCLRER
jgi:DNA-binding NarL/FixJ family response regulator